jgi:hypothetical protein
VRSTARISIRDPEGPPSERRDGDRPARSSADALDRHRPADRDRGMVYLAKGRFLTDAANAPPARDTRYGFVELLLTL